MARCAGGSLSRIVNPRPAQLPYQFFVKVEAIDRAGNLGEDATAQAVKVDLSIPKAIPLTVTPAN